MNALFNLDLPSEFLSEEEIRHITGAARADMQIDWLKRQKWIYVVNAARRPVVGRLFARMKLAGVNTAGLNVNLDGWQPDLSSLN